MRKTHCRTWNMGKKTKKRGQLEMDTVGLWQEN